MVSENGDILSPNIAPEKMCIRDRCENAEEVGKALQALNVFAIPLGPGIRVSVASNTVEECRAIPGRLQQAIESVNGK